MFTFTRNNLFWSLIRLGDTCTIVAINNSSRIAKVIMEIRRLVQCSDNELGVLALVPVKKNLFGRDVTKGSCSGKGYSKHTTIFAASLLCCLMVGRPGENWKKLQITCWVSWSNFSHTDPLQAPHLVHYWLYLQVSHSAVVSNEWFTIYSSLIFSNSTLLCLW